MIVNRICNFNLISTLKTKTRKLPAMSPDITCFSPKLSIPKVSFIRKLFASKSKLITLKMDNGNDIQAQVIRQKPFEWHISCNGDCLGYISASRSRAPIRGDNLPEYYKDKEYLFINHIDSNKKYKGIGTELIRTVVEESNRLGFDGRVCLNATTIKPSFGSPVPFYEKIGFRCSNNSFEKEIQSRIAKNLSITGEFETPTMFLPREKAIELLNNC